MITLARFINTSNFEFEPPTLHGLKPEIRELIDLRDPDIEYVIEAIRIMSIAGCDPEDPEVIKMAIKAGHARAVELHDDTSLQYHAAKQRWLEKEAAINRRMEKHEATSRVYYARLGNRVKIGYTHNVRKRMADLMAEELLATERGGLELEAERHKQFAQLRTRGEWFRYEDELVEHVAELHRQAAS